MGTIFALNYQPIDEYKLRLRLVWLYVNSIDMPKDYFQSSFIHFQGYAISQGRLHAASFVKI